MDLQSLALDPALLPLYLAAAALSTVGLFILYREGRARRRAAEEARAALEAERAEEAAQRGKRKRNAAKRRRG